MSHQWATRKPTCFSLPQICVWVAHGMTSDTEVLFHGAAPTSTRALTLEGETSHSTWFGTDSIVTCEGRCGRRREQMDRVSERRLERRRETNNNDGGFPRQRDSKHHILRLQKMLSGSTYRRGQRVERRGRAFGRDLPRGRQREERDPRDDRRACHRATTSTTGARG